MSILNFKTKIILITFSLFLFFGLAQHSFAATTYYWVGGSDGADVNSSSNWTTSNPASCTGGGAGVPVSGDTVIFDADCDNGATVSSNWTVYIFTMSSGYAGTVTVNSGVTLTTNGATTISSGTLTAVNLTVNNSQITVSSGANLTVTNLTDSSSPFTLPASGVNITNISFLAGDVNSANNPLVANGNVTMASGVRWNGSQALQIKGDFTTAGANGYSSSPIQFNGTGDQTWTYNGSGYFGGGAITINKASGAMNFAGNAPNIYTLDLTSGTVSLPTLTTNGATSIGASGSLTVTTMSITGAQITISTGGTFAVTNLTISSCAFTLPASGVSITNITFLAGDINATANPLVASGNVSMSSGVRWVSSQILKIGGNFTTAGANGYGSSPIQFNGTGDQTWTYNGSGYFGGGAITVNKASGTLTLAGNSPSLYTLTLTAGALNTSNLNLTLASGIGLTVPTGFTFTAVSGALSFDSLTVSGGTFNGGSGTTTLAANGFVLSGGTFNANSGALVLTAGNYNTFTHTAGGTFNAGTGRIEIGSTINTNTAGVGDTFYDFTINMSSANASFTNSGSAVTVSHNFYLQRGNMNSGTYHLTGPSAVFGPIAGQGNGSSSVIIDGSGAQVVTFAGGLLPSITLNNASATVSYTGGTSFNYLALTNMSGTFSVGSLGLTVNGAFSQAAGTFDGGSSTTTITGTFTLTGGTFNANAGAFVLSGSAGHFTHTAGGTFNAGTSSFSFTGSSQNINTSIASVGDTFYDFIVNQNSTNSSFTNNGAAITVSHTFSHTRGNMNSGIYHLTGPTSNFGPTGGGGPGSSDVKIDGSSAQTVNFYGGNIAGITLNNASATVSYTGATTFNALAITNMSGTFSLGSTALTVSGAFSQAAGTFDGGSATIAISSSGGLTLTGGTFNASSGTMTITNGNPKMINHAAGSSGTPSSGGVFNAGTGTIVFSTTNNYTVVAPGDTFNNVTFSSGTNNNVSLSSGTITVNGLLTLNNGQVTSGTINHKGNIVVNSGWQGSSANFALNFASTTAAQTISGAGAGTSFTTGAVTVNSGAILQLSGTTGISSLTVASGGTFSLGGDETFTGTPTLSSGSTVEYTATSSSRAVKSWTYTNATLKINGSGGTFTWPATGTTTALNVNAGTFDQGANNLTITSTSTIGTGGEWRNVSTGDAYIGTGGVVNYGIVYFNANGAAASSTKDILIRSTTAAAQRSWTGNGFFIMSNVDVKDQGLTGGPTITVYYGLNIGNNGSNWFFINSSLPTKNWRGTTSSVWSVASNWLEGAAPTGSDTAVFGSGGGYTAAATFDSSAVAPASIQISGNYSSTVTLGKDISLSSFTQAGGTFNTNVYSIISSGLASISGGTFTIGNGANSFNAGLTVSGGTVNARTTVLNGLLSGLVGYWNLDQGANTSATDSSGNGNTGTLVNGPSWTSSVPTVNFSDPYSVSFDGNNDYISISNEPNFDITDEITITAWINPSNVSSNNPIFSKLWSAYTFEVEGGKLQFQANRGASPVRARSTTSLSTGNWYFVAFRFNKNATDANGKYHSLYVNGNLETLSFQEGSDTNSAFGTNNSTPMIGERSGQGLYFNGKIDDVRVYNRALSPGEITTLASGSSTSPTPSVSTTNLTLSGGTYQAGTTTNISGNFAKTSGTFNANSGTVNLTGSGTNQQLTGTTTFYNLTKSVTASSTLTFGSSQTTTITGTTTLNGASGQLLYLRATTPGNQWRFDPQGGLTLSYLDVKDSNNISTTTTGAHPLIDAANYTGLTDASGVGSNTNWTFTVPVLTVAATGTQQATTSLPVTSKYMGGAFVLSKNIGTSTVTNIVLTQSGSLPTANISSVSLFYKDSSGGLCSNTSSIPSGTTLFGTATTWSSSRATTTNAGVSIGTTPVCFYVQFNLSGVLTDTLFSNTVDLVLNNPSTDVVSAGSTISPATTADILGATVVTGSGSGYPTISISAADTSMSTGASTIITWSTGQNPQTCTSSGTGSGGTGGDWGDGASQNATGGSVSSGSFSVDGSYTFTLTCTNTVGSTSGSVSVTVIDPLAPTLSMDSSPNSFTVSGTSTISWTLGVGGGGVTCTPSGGNGTWTSQTITSSGSWVTPNLTSTQTYTLTCSNSHGTRVRSASVSIGSGGPPADYCTVSGYMFYPPNAPCDYYGGSVTSGGDVYGDSITLTGMADPAQEPTVFYLKDNGLYNALYMKQGPNPTVRKLTADGLTITSGTLTTFACAGTSNDCRAVKINLVLKKTGLSGNLQNYTVTKTFKTTAKARNNAN